MEMVSSGKIDHVYISSIIAWHTKVSPDQLFSAITSAYKVADADADVLTIDDLKTLCDRSARRVIKYLPGETEVL